MALLSLALPACQALQPPAHKPLNLVTPSGKGRIVVPASDDIQWGAVNLFDQGTRPVFQIKIKYSNVDVSYALFPNLTKSTKPDICRDDIVNAAIRGTSPVPGLVDIKNGKNANHTQPAGSILATGTFLVKSMGDLKIAQQNLFGVASSPTLCAEVHVSKVSYTPADDALLSAQLDHFQFDPDYLPTFADYFQLANIFYRVTQSFAPAAFYYQAALDSLPTGADLQSRRLVTDQLVLSYGMSGDLKQSQALAQRAIELDPDYPLNYYNLACADAEEGHAEAARIHLEQAFARKANTLPGEHLPNPTQDDSLLKLKNNKPFWTFVQTLQ